MSNISLLTRVREWVRCTRHNWLHLNIFRLRYDGQTWHVRDRGGAELRFPYYPYLVFLEIEGYLRQGKWALSPGMTVVDAGACVGEFSLYAARCVGPTGRVLMLEPDPDNLKKAAALFAFNGGQPPQLTVVPTGLWRERGTLSFAAGQGEQSALVTNNAAASASSDQLIRIEVHSIASLAETYGLTRLDFLKVDIEGAETEVIAAADGPARQFSPRFSIASYHPWQNGQTRDMLEPTFRQMGFVVETGFPVHQTTWAWREPV